MARGGQAKPVKAPVQQARRPMDGPTVASGRTRWRRRDDPRACDGVPAEAPSSVIIIGKSADVLSLKAIVLMKTFGALFDRDGLKSVEMRVLLYRADQSDLAAEGNILSLAAALPRPRGRKSRQVVMRYLSIHVRPCWRQRRRQPTKMQPAWTESLSIDESKRRSQPSWSKIYKDGPIKADFKRTRSLVGWAKARSRAPCPPRPC
jgi:hypothetical protein